MRLNGWFGISVFFLLSSWFVSGILAHAQDVILLKNGKEVTGKILSRNNKSIVIDSGIGSGITYYSDEITSVNQQPFLLTGQEENKQGTDISQPQENSTNRANNEQRADNSLDDQYHKLLNEATDAINKKDGSLAEEKIKMAIDINPQGKDAYNDFAVLLYLQGKPEDAAKYFYKAVDLGFTPSRDEEMMMIPYKYREFSITWPGGPAIPFKGNTNCSEQLILNMLPSIVASAGKPEDVIVIKPKFIRWGEQGKYWEEEWKVEANNGSRDFSLTLTPTPDGGADYKITPKGASVPVQEANGVNPEETNAALQSAYDSIQKNDCDTASPSIEKAISLDPQNGQAYYYKGWCLFKKQDYDGAIDALQKSEDLGLKEDNLYLSLGLAYIQKNMSVGSIELMQKAESALLKFLKAEPNNPGGLYAMAMVKYDMKDFNASLDYISRAEAQGASDSSGLRQKIQEAQNTRPQTSSQSIEQNEQHSSDAVAPKWLGDNLLFQILIVVVAFGLVAILITVFVPGTKKEQIPALNMVTPPLVNELPRTADFSFTKAGPNKRVCAYLIDSLVMILPNWPVWLFIGTTYTGILPLIYILFKDTFNGQSIGKRIVGLQVIDERNQAAQPVEAIIRNIPLAGASVLYLINQWLILAVFIVPLIEYSVMLNDKNGQRIGDTFVNTRVQDLKPQIKDNVFLLISIVIMIIMGLINFEIMPKSILMGNQSSPTADGIAIAKAEMFFMCQAAESYAKTQGGVYPENMSLLTDANPPYFQDKYNYCGQSHLGFTYTCSMSTSGYTLKAAAADGSITYIVTTGCTKQAGF